MVALLVLAFAAGATLLVARGGGGHPVSIDVSVKGTTMTPSQWSARQDDSVTVTITTDRDEEIHLHGYDISFHARAGVAVSRTFRADRTGDFPIEIEDSGTPLGSFRVSP